jgi:hypothetical protein
MSVSRAETHAPPLMWLHALIFTAGVFALPVSVFGRLPQFQLVAGVCFLLTAALSALGVRVTFAGPVGSTLRRVLGPARVTAIYLRIVFWVLIGVVITAWGIQRVLDHDPHVLQVQDPMISVVR